MKIEAIKDQARERKNVLKAWEMVFFDWLAPPEHPSQTWGKSLCHYRDHFMPTDSRTLFRALSALQQIRDRTGVSAPPQYVNWSTLGNDTCA